MKLVTPLVCTAVLLVSVAAAAILRFGGIDSNTAQPTANQLVGVTPNAEELHIYPPHVGQELVTSEDFMTRFNLAGRPFKRQQKVDGSVTDIYLRQDLTPEFALEYFPAPVGTLASLKAITLYAADGQTPAGQAIFGVNGIRQLRAVVLPNGDYQTFSYYDDGVTVADMKETGKGPDQYDNSPQLLREKRFRLDHSVSYESALNPDSSRDVTLYDDSGLPLTVSKIARYGMESTVNSFFPGTRQVRLSLTTTYDKTTARLFRRDGTLDKTVELSSGMITITFYDAPGKTVVLTQIWFFTRDEVNGVAKMKNLHIFEVTEPDAQGHDARAWVWSVLMNSSPTMWSYTEFNKLAGSPPVLCANVRTFYTDEGWSNKTECDPADRKLPGWTQAHTAQDNLRPPPVPAAEVVFPQLEDLPIPQEQHEPGMH